MARYIRNYEVVGELGSGHFGTVMTAVGEVPGRGLSAGKRRLVAIKKIKDSADHHSRELLRQEFALLDQVKHRCIVRVYEYIEDENAVVMEYIHGVTLRQMLDACASSREQVFTDAAIEMVCELADALYQAYTTPGDNGEALQLVHRDLKPDNIMLTPQGEVKILDFGLARVDNVEIRTDDNDRIKGTPIYMAPEQASGNAVDHRSDLFSLGLIAYELFMNRPAYVLPENSRDPLGDIFDAIERGALMDECRELERKLPKVGPILSKLLQANPRQRYQTGQDLLVDLKRQLYRDRGSHVKEFCEFFFGSLYELPEPPDISRYGRGGGAAPARGAATSGGGGGKRMSMEERLRASMAREGRAREAEQRPSTWKGAGAEPAAGRAAPAPRAESWNPGGAAAKRDRQPLKQVGQRSPDETGMLQMVSLDHLSDEGGGNDHSATAFFAIPAPKTDSRPVAPAPMPTVPPPPGLNPPGGQYGSPVAQGPMMGGIAQGPTPGGFMGPTPGIAGPQAGGIMGPTPGGISGPVASGGANTPFNVPNAASATPQGDEDRVQTNRVYAIVLAMFFLMGVSVVAAIYLSTQGDDAEVSATDDAVDEGATRRTMRTARAEPKGDQDSGAVEVEAAPPPKPERTTPRTNTNTTPKTNNATSNSSSSKPGTLTITMGANTGGNTAVEVVCPSAGYRQRFNKVGGKVVATGVPSEMCDLHFKGAPPAKGQARGGSSVTCNIVGTTADCK
ncbi:MAG: serine/threonine protein kinase [Alphaproteobacteria bacterium]|nr:serine/threonine protein kinase [Alphaproteobacteria bacterium]